MKDCFEIIRDVMLPERQVPNMRVGIEAAAAIVTALNREGWVLIRDPKRDPGRAPDPFVDAAERAALGLP